MGLNPNFRGSSEEHQVDVNKLRRQVHGVHVDAWQMVRSPMMACAILGVFGLIATMSPTTILFMALLGVPWYWIVKLVPSNAQAKLELRLPTADVPDKLDWGDPRPGRKEPWKARGMFMFGNSWKGNRELWGGITDILTHMLVLGGTGAGKTEQLVSMAYNAVALGSGYAYVDPKASPKLFAQHWIMLRTLGRDDDSRVMNFAVGDEKLVASPAWRSNSMQPFAIGKSEKLKEIPLSLMAGAGGGGNDANAIFSSNGKTLMTALVMALTDLRDAGVIPFSVNDMREFIGPDKFVELVANNEYRKHLAQATIESCESFLKSLGWNPNEKDKSKWGDFSRQYSFAQNYFLEPLSTMADTYRHIFNVPVGEIHMVDVILQRRALVVLLPSLEKSKKEAKSLGQITLAQLRIATAVGLGGGEIMGSYSAIVESSATAARSAFQIIIDEFAAISVDGFAEVFTQGRSLYISATAASQDWAGFKKANEAEAQQILANSKFKFIMTGDDPNDTKKLIQDLAGEVDEIRTSGYQIKGLINYMDNLAASSQRVSRVDMRDIAAQIEGEWHLFFKDKIIRGRGFYAGADPLKGVDTPLFVHHMLMVEKPSLEQLSMKYGAMRELLDFLESERSNTNRIDKRQAGGFVPVVQVFELSAKVEQTNKRILLTRREVAATALAAWLKDQPPFDARAFVRMAMRGGKPVEQGSLVESLVATTDHGAMPAEMAGEIPTPMEAQDPSIPDIPDVPMIGMPPPSEQDLLTDPDYNFVDPIEFDESSIGATSLDGADTPVIEGVDQPFQPRAGLVMTQGEDDDFDMPSARNFLHSAMTALVDDQKRASKAIEDIREINQALASESDQKVASAEETREHLGRATAQVIKEPPYPEPPKPEKIEPAAHRSQLSSWINELKKPG